MAYKSIETARAFAKRYFHDAKIYKTSSGYEVLPYSANKSYKSWKLVERRKK